MRFSARTDWDTTETEWAKAFASRRVGSLPFYDLTIANPTQCGFRYNEHLLAALDQTAATHYEPLPFGLISAREAVCEYYRDHATTLNHRVESDIAPEQVILTTSTSEAYSFLFRLLCDPGDEVLIAQPSYPLFDFLATLDDVKPVSYPLFYDHGWHLDLHGLRMKIGPRTRAIVIVHPNNPTGHFTREADRHALESICEEFGLALIVDEVFLDYSLQGQAASFVTGAHPALTFVLSGLSKVAGLPQMKLSWIAAFGPEDALQAALSRLDVIADTFLSMSAPLQLALPAWLGGRVSIQQQIRGRVKENLAILDSLLRHEASVDRLEVEGGWSATLRAPAVRTGDDMALWLIAEHGIAVHPGAFFGMASEGYLVASLLAETRLFQAGAASLVHLLGTAV
jgi:alanine-synthesizing transaminase